MRSSKTDFPILRQLIAILGLALLLAPIVNAKPSRDPRSAALQRRMARTIPSEGLRISVVLREPDAQSTHSLRRGRIRRRQNRVLARVRQGGVDISHRYRSLSGFAGWAQAEAIEALAADPEVVFIDVDRKAYASLTQGAALVGASSVQSLGYTGSGVGVAILDSGIDTDHPFLSANIAAEACFCDDAPGLSGCCPNGQDTQSGAGSSEDDNGHGTQVAGVVASTQSGGKGVAPDASIISLKVLNNLGTGSFADIADALDWVISNRVSHGIKVVNLSLGDGGEYDNATAFPCSGSNTANAISQLKTLGVAVFVASGNEGHDNGISYPSCVDQAISVGGVYDASIGGVSWCGTTCDTILCTDNPTTADKFVCHTNDGSLLDILAPDYRTTTATVGGGTSHFGGTSAASPYAAGQAAQLFQVDPSLSPDDILSWLTAGSPMVTNPDNSASYPRTRVDLAVEYLTAVCGDGSVSGGEECDDGNTSSGDCCDDSCTFETAGSSCDDNDLCTASEACDGAGSCAAISALDCDDINPCTDDACTPATGCQYSNNSVPCDDLDACTDGDVCESGSCTPGPPLVCDDSNLCTDDACSSPSGCSFTNNSVACDDGNACSAGDICAGGSCAAGAPLVCDDTNPCTDDGCLPGSGCAFTNNSDSCDDGDVCSLDDVCVAGACSAGHQLDCDDGDDCTADGCDELTGCSHELIATCGQAVTPIPGLGIIGRMLVLTTLMTSALSAISWRGKERASTPEP